MRLELLARSLADQIDAIVRADRQAVLLLSRDPEVTEFFSAGAERRKGAGATVKKTLEYIVGANSDFSAAFLMDPDGTVALSTNPAHAGKSFSAREYFRRALAGEAYISKVLIGSTTHQPGMYYSSPVKGPDGGVVGVAVIKFEGKTLWQVAAGLKIEAGSAFLVDEDQVVIAHPDPSACFLTVGPTSDADMAKIDPQSRFQEQTIGSLGLADLSAAVVRAAEMSHAEYVDAAKVRRIAGLARLYERPWVLGVDVPAAQFTAPLDRLGRQHGWTVLAVCGAMVVVALLLCREMVKPMNRLVAAAGRLEQGDYAGARVEPSSEDELGRLTRAFNAMAGGLRAREHERDIFGRVVSPEVRERLLAGELKLGGETRYVSVLFTDIRGFSTTSEKMTPQQVVTFLNEYLTAMADAIRPFDGYINNFLGDAIVVIFGAPTRRDRVEKSAARAALAMRRSLAALNAAREARGEDRLDSGIGIGSGDVVAGQIGSLERLMYTVIGDAVNVAARLEALTKEYPGRHILVNGPTARVLQGEGFDLERIGWVPVKGRVEPVEVYAVGEPAS